jgi:response regulator RpfG family c-di-GMP phosphodiesterase
MQAQKIDVEATTADSGTNDAPLKGRILCVDDEAQILMSLKRMFRRSGHKVHIANSAAEGLEWLADNEVDIVISDMRMPEMDGHQFLTEVANQWPQTVRMLLTGYSDMESTIGAINNGSIFRYIAKPWDDTDLQMCVERALENKFLRDERDRLESLTRQQNDDLQALNQSLEAKVKERTKELVESRRVIESAYDDSIAVFARIIDLREGDSQGRSGHIVEQADRVAKRLKLDEIQRKDLQYAAQLHNIGKIGLPDDLIMTPYEKMEPDQKALYQQHSTNGEALLMALGPLSRAATIIRSHHEQVGGNGYPDKLSGEDIPIEARILFVVAEYDDLRSGALLGTPMDSAAAIRYLKSNAGRRYDERVVEEFVLINKDLEESQSVRKELILSIDNVEPGMILAEDVYLRENVLMLRAGQTLTATFIAKYKSLKDESQDSRLLKIVTS